MLEIKNLEISYEEIQVLWGIDLEVKEGEVIALVGSNGAGKSTLLKAISGLIGVKAGDILFNDRSIQNSSYDKIVRMGISQVPEGRRLFAGMTVKENLMMGSYSRKNGGEIEEDLQWVFSIFPVLEERKSQLAGKLSGGEQQMCAIGRGLMARPKLLLIDELSLGLAPIVIESLLGVIDILREKRIALLLVEQDVQTAFECADRGYVLERGKIVLEGRCCGLLTDEYVKTAYLGL